MPADGTVLIFNKDNYKVVVGDYDTYTAYSADVDCRKEYRLNEEAYKPSSQHFISVSTQGSVMSSCILAAVGGATGIHDHSALICGDSCIIAVGPFMCSLRIPSLDLEWKAEVDWATCFGVYYSAKHDCLISHGELVIARVEHGGEIVWSSGGKDIFTGEFKLFDDYIEVTDFNDESYRFDITTGKEK